MQNRVHFLVARRLSKELRVCSLTLAVSALSVGCIGVHEPIDDEPSSSASGGSQAEVPEGEPGAGGSSSGGSNSRTFLTPLVSQTAQWANFDITIEEASTGRCTTSGLLGGEIIDCHCVDGTAQNRTRLGASLGGQKWDLILADGTRLMGDADRLEFGPLDALPFSSCYEDASKRPLAGAVLELHGSKYGTFEPLRIPLDTPMEKEPVLRLDELIGKVFGPGEDGTGFQHEVIAAQVAMNGDVPAARALTDKKLFSMKVRTMAVGQTSNLFKESFHLMVNGIGVSTDTYIAEIPPVDEPIELDVVFQIDADAQEFEVEFDTEPNPNEEVFVVGHVDLSRAVQVE